MSATHSGGGTLLAAGAVSILKTRLLPMASVVTPNVAEATVLSGVRIDSLGAARAAAQRISELGPKAVVVKGGIWRAPKPSTCCFTQVSSPSSWRLAQTVGDVHGTGCTFASAIAAGLALGDDIPAAVQRAKRYITGALAHSFEIGRGARILNHFWELSL